MTNSQNNFTIYVLNHSTNRPPKQGYDSHGLDLFFDSPEPVTLERGRVYCIPLGVTLYSDPQEPEHGDVFLLPRSSSGLIEKSDRLEHGNGIVSYVTSSIHLTNTVALLDWDFRGVPQARVELNSAAPSPVVIPPERSVLQIIPRSPFARFKVVQSLDEIPPSYLKNPPRRGANGLGSSDQGEVK